MKGSSLFTSLSSGDRGDGCNGGGDGVPVEVMGEVVMLVSAFIEHFCAGHYAEHFMRTVSFNHYSSSRRVEKFLFATLLLLLFYLNILTIYLIQYHVLLVSGIKCSDLTSLYFIV